MKVFDIKYWFAIPIRIDYVIPMKRYVVNANFIDNMKSENLQKKLYNLYIKVKTCGKGVLLVWNIHRWHKKYLVS